MGLVKALKRKLGKKKTDRIQQQAGDQGLMDPLVDPLLGDGHVKKVDHLQTATAAGAIDKVKYRRDAVGKGKAKRGFFKSNAGMEDPMLRMASQIERNQEVNAVQTREDRDARRAADEAGVARPRFRDRIQLSQEEKHMAARAVTSSRVDKLLGTDVLSDERFAVHNGQVGVSSMQVAGESLRADEKANWKKKGGSEGGGTYQNYLDVDFSQASVQRDMSNLQVNDYLTGQVDRHTGNMFYDDKTGRLRGIDNDLSFGDKFNERFGDPNTGMAKHVNEMPKYIDAATAQKILEIDLLDYWEMLQGDASDPQRLTIDEATDGMERMSRLQDHVRALMAKAQGEDVDVQGEIVGEWNADTYARQVSDEGDSYLKRASTGLDDAKAQVAADDIKTGVSKPGQKRDIRHDKKTMARLKRTGNFLV